jgi:hypothetical protein
MAARIWGAIPAALSLAKFMRPLCALAWRKALRVASPPGDRGGFIMLTRGTSEKRSTTATIADGAADRSDEVGIGGPCPVNLLRSAF